MNRSDEKSRVSTVADTTVVIATRNRAERIAETLKYLFETQVFGDWDVLVVNNGSTDFTEQVLRELEIANPRIRSIHDAMAGKARALNIAIRCVSSPFIAFTDDDVRPSPNWLTELRRAFNEPGCGAVCGPILPEYPDSTPAWMRKHPYAGFAFGHFNPDVPDGPLPSYMFPFGANFAARTDALKTLRFREDLGRTRECPWRMCADTEFMQRLRSECGGIIFMRRAAVKHFVPASNVERTWILERAFHLGRSYIVMNPHVISFHPGTNSTVREVVEFEVAVQLNFYCGMLRQLNDGGVVEPMDTVFKLISRLPLPMSAQMLGRSAREWLQEISARQN